MKKETLENILEFMAAAIEEETETEVLGTLTPEELARVEAATVQIDEEKERIKSIIEEEAERLRAEMHVRLSVFIAGVEEAERAHYEKVVSAAKNDLREVMGKYTENVESVKINRGTGEISRELERVQ